MFAKGDAKLLWKVRTLYETDGRLYWRNSSNCILDHFLCLPHYLKSMFWFGDFRGHVLNPQFMLVCVLSQNANSFHTVRMQSVHNTSLIWEGRLFLYKNYKETEISELLITAAYVLKRGVGLAWSNMDSSLLRLDEDGHLVKHENGTT